MVWLNQYLLLLLIDKLCLTLCGPIDCTMPGFPVLHCLLEFAQTHVCWVDNVIQPSHPFSPPSCPILNLSQHQGLFQWLDSYHQVVKVLELQLRHESFQWIFRVDFLEDWLVWSPCSPGVSQESSPTPQFKSLNCLALSILYGPTLIFICDLPWNLIKSRGLQMSEPRPLISTLLSWISFPAKPPFNKVTRNSPRLFLRSSLLFPAGLWNYPNQPITSFLSSQKAPPKACSLCP